MKKIIYSIFTLLCIVLSNNGFGQCSVSAPVSSTVTGQANYIQTFALNSVNSVGSSSIGINRYTNLSSTNTFSVQSGSNVNIQWSVTGPGTACMWIDFNNNGTFDGSEMFYQSPNQMSENVSVQLPLTSQLNTPLKARLRIYYTPSFNPPSDPCLAYDDLIGETEDYSVVFTCPSNLSFLSNTNIIASGESQNNTYVCNNSGFLTVKYGPFASFTSTWMPGNSTASLLPVSTTSTSITYSATVSMAGCPLLNNSLSRTFTILQTPTISLSGNTSICAGQSTTISGTGASLYWWDHLGGAQNPVTLSPTTTTVYTVTGINYQIDFPVNQAFTGCKHTLTPTVQVSASPTITISNATVCAGNSFTINPSGATSYTYSGGSAIVSPTATTVYTVSGSNGTCSSSKTFTLTTTAGPSITVNNGTICAGNSFTINPSGATSYTYSGGSAIVSPTVTSNYVVTGSNGGCATSKTVTVNVNNAPVVSASNGTICSGSSFSLSPTGANTYTVSGGSSVVSPTITTSYTVSGTSAQGCVSQAPYIATVSVNATPTITASNGTICAGSSFTINPSGATSYTYSGGSAVVAPTTNTTYVVTGANGNCSSTKNVTVTVNPLPATYINSGSPNFTQCAGTNIEIQTMAANPAFYSTINGVQTTINSSYNYTVDATYTQTYTTVVTNTITGCSKTLATFTVTVPSATIVAVTNNTNLCVGQSAVLTASTVAGGVSLQPFTWYPGSFGIGSSSVSVNPTVTTVYTVSAQDQSGYGCNFSTTITQNVSTCTGIEEATANNLVSIYPNPANDFITVQLMNETTGATIQILNALGEIVLTENATTNGTLLKTDNLTNGIYFVKVESKNGKAIRKFIKQ